VRDVFVVIEQRIIDRGLIDGLQRDLRASANRCGSCRTDQVQFYFALGLILMGGVVIRFVIWGGGSR